MLAHWKLLEHFLKPSTFNSFSIIQCFQVTISDTLFSPTNCHWIHCLSMMNLERRPELLELDEVEELVVDLVGVEEEDLVDVVDLEVELPVAAVNR